MTESWQLIVSKIFLRVMTQPKCMFLWFQLLNTLLSTMNQVFRSRPVAKLLLFTNDTSRYMFVCNHCIGMNLYPQLHQCMCLVSMSMLEIISSCIYVDCIHLVVDGERFYIMCLLPRVCHGILVEWDPLQGVLVVMSLMKKTRCDSGDPPWKSVFDISPCWDA